MAVSLSFANQDHVGPGYAFTWIISAGPVPVDDFIEVLCRPTGTGVNFTDQGAALTRGFLVGSVIFGESNVPSYVLANGLSVQVTNGTGMDITVNQRHANGTLVATTTYVNQEPWDSSTRSFRLVEYIASLLSSASSGSVLNAVQHTYQNQP